MNLQPEFPQLKIKLDFRAYYKKFSEQHGGFPIVYKDRQLFADGWQYSLTDYQGPEWPPPEDPKELHRLKSVYWYTRWNRAKNELMIVRQRIDALRGLQENMSGPLQHVIMEEDETGKQKWSGKTEDLDLKLFDYVIHWLESEIKECDQHLNELKGANHVSAVSGENS